MKRSKRRKFTSTDRTVGIRKWFRFLITKPSQRLIGWPLTCRLYQPAPDYTAATKETAKTAEALPVVSSLANRIMSVPRPTPTVQTQTTVPDDMRNKPPAKPTGESLSRILPVATTAPLSFDYTRVPSTGKPDAGMHSPSSARSFRTADEHVADKSDDVVPAIPESARLHDAEEVFGSPRFSNDCPPTTSPKALDRLVGLPTTSPKAISTLTGKSRVTGSMKYGSATNTSGLRCRRPTCKAQSKRSCPYSRCARSGILTVSLQLNTH